MVRNFFRIGIQALRKTCPLPRFVNILCLCCKTKNVQWVIVVKDDFMAKWLVEEIPGKPDGWPTYNLREAKVDRVWQRVRDFYKSPDPMRRDMMLRDAFCRQRGDLPSVGPKYRVSEYEGVVLKHIYLAGCCFNSWTLKLFAYHVVM